jgi:hypothetical protein
LALAAAHDERDASHGIDVNEGCIDDRTIPGVKGRFGRQRLAAAILGGHPLETNN